MKINLAIKLAIVFLLLVIHSQSACAANQTITAYGCMDCPGNQVPSPARDRCLCPAGNYLSLDGVTCVPCPAGQIPTPSGDGCYVNCPLGSYLNSAGQCVPCSGLFIVNAARDRCICRPPAVDNGAGGCNCIAPNAIIGGVCTCPNGFIYSNGICSCPYPLVLNTATGSCQCPNPFVLSGSSCVCPNSKVYSGGACVCPSPLIQNPTTGLCGCPSPFTLSGGICVGCGNRIVETPQQCDSTAGCNSNCQCNPGYIANLGVCVSNIICGNGFVEGNQACDNGNNAGCSRNCQVDYGWVCNTIISPLVPSKFISRCTLMCGNGIVDPGQQCDNGGMIGCQYFCRPDLGYTCTAVINTTSTCQVACGDGIRSGNQQCDNGNREGCIGCVVDPAYVCVGLFGSTSRCTKRAACGNGILEAGERCDNGGRAGCSSNCVPDPGYTCFGSLGSRSSCASCGNGILQSGQQCDNGGQLGCLSGCRVDAGYTCRGTVFSNCYKAGPRCGNGVVEIAESCDDGNLVNGDGCNSFCFIQDSYICNAEFGQQSRCIKKNTTNLPVCGNGIYEPQSASSIINLGQSGVNGYNPNPNVPNSFGFNAYYGEQCDNGNQVGCRGCVIEKDWTCRNVVGQPSICTANIVLPKCGNGIYEPSFGEQCDDGNTNNGDGCNVFCNVEAYWVCPNGINCVLINNYIPSGCGNGMYEPSRGQECDDGNTVKGDGCSEKCKVQYGYVCGQVCLSSPRCADKIEGRPTTCKKNFAFCGNGVVDAGEECDDGFPLYNGDGCSNRCKIEKEWSCYSAGGTGSTKCFKI